MEILATFQSCELYGPNFIELSALPRSEIFHERTLLNLLQVGAIPNPSREQLIDVVQRHFMSQVCAKFQNAFLNPSTSLSDNFFFSFPSKQDMIAIMCSFQKYLNLSAEIFYLFFFFWVISLPQFPIVDLHEFILIFSFSFFGP